MKETIELAVKGPEVDASGLKTIRSYVQSLDRFHKLASKPLVVRVEVQGMDRAQQALEKVRQTTSRAAVLPQAAQKPSVYLSSLQTHLSALSRYTSEFHVTMAKLKAGFKSPEQKIEFFAGLEDQITRVGASARKFSFRQPADREGFFESLKSASNMIKLETNAMHEAQVELMKSKESAALFQSPEDRKGAARGKTDALASSEKSLAVASGQARQGIVEQDRALLSKIETLRTTTAATDALSRSEKRLATSASTSASAERGAMIKRVDRDGVLKSRTYAVSPGVTQMVAPSASGDSVTIATDKLAQMRSRVKEINEEFARLLTKRKAEGAGVREISAIYTQQAHALDRLAGEYSQIEEATGRMIARQAESARTKSGATRSIAARKAEANDQKRSLKEGVEFQKRIAADRWMEIQKIEDSARAKIGAKSAAGARASEITRIYNEAAREIAAVSKNFKSSEDAMEGARRSAQFRSKGHQVQLRSDTLAERKMIAQAARDNKAFRQRIQQASSQQLAADTFSDMQARGFKESGRGRMRTGSGSREVIDFTKENAAMRENVRLMVERDAKGRIVNATTTEGARSLKQTADAAGYLSKNFLQNTATVAVWAASVGAFYGSLAILRSGMDAAVNYDRKFAALTVVFRGTETQAAQLRDEVLQLAVAYGQSGSEALDAAIRFSRLGMSQAQTLEAVRASLMAANVAEMGVGEAADALAAIMATFNLQAKDLAGVINRLNAVSNTYNVTNKDMIGGLARVGSVARTAGLSLEETMGTVASVVARTGRSGAEAGNALKSIIVSLSNPTKQKNLSDLFQFSVTDQTGELKSMSDVLRELFLRYQDLTSAEQQHLLQTVAGKQQASRLAAMIDGYVDSQLMAIRSVTNLDSAEKENARIKQSLIVQVQSLATAYERLVYNLSNSGGNVAIIGTLREMTAFLRNVITLMGTYSDATAVVLGLTALFAARMGVTAYRVAETGKQINFATNTAKAFRAGINNLQSTLATMNREMIYSGSRTLSFTRGMMGAAGATRGLGIALAWTTGAMKALLAATAIGLALYGVMLLVNTIAESTGSQWEKASQKLAGFNEELERMRGLSEGNRLSQRLAATIMSRLRSGNVNPSEAEKYITAGSEIAGGGDEHRRKRIESDLREAYQKGGTVGLEVRFEQMLNSLKKEGLRLADERNAKESIAVKQAAANLKLAEAELSVRRDSADAQKRVQEARKAYMDAMGASVKTAIYGEDPEAANEADRQEELRQQKTKTRMEKMMEARMKAAASVQEAFSTISPSDKAAMEVSSIDAQIQEIKKLQAETENQAKADIAAAEAAQVQAKSRYDSFVSYKKTIDAISGLNEGLALLKDKQSGLGSEIDSRAAALRVVPGMAPVPPAPNLQRIAIDEAIKASEAKLSALNAKRDLMEKSNPDILQSSKTAMDALSDASKITSQKRNELEIQRDIARTKMEELETKRRELEIELRVADVLKAQQTGRRQGEMATASLQYGNETQRILRERKTLLDPAGVRDKETGMAMNIAAAKQDFDRAKMTGDEVEQARSLEQLRTMAIRIQEQEFTLLQRKLSIEAAIHEETRKTNQERSRSLLMSDREGQLRAAAAEKLGRKQGAFKADDFMFLSQETKQSIAQTNPDLLPPEMRTELQQLREEFDLSKDGIKNFSESIEAMRKTIEMIENLRMSPKGEGAMDPSQFNPKDMIAKIDQSGAAAVEGLRQIGDATVSKFMEVARVSADLARQIRQVSLGDAAANAQSAARPT